MQRPTSATVFGILNIIFGALGLCGLAISLPMFLTADNPMAQQNPVIGLMRENPGYMVYTQVSMVLSLVAVVALIAAGIGLLNMRPWARTVSIVYAVYAIVSGLLGLALYYVIIFGPLMERFNEIPPGPERAGTMGGAMGGLIGGCVGIIYPVILLIFMYRPTLRSAFAAAGDASHYESFGAMPPGQNDPHGGYDSGGTEDPFRK